MFQILEQNQLLFVNFRKTLCYSFLHELQKDPVAFAKLRENCQKTFVIPKKGHS